MSPNGYNIAYGSIAVFKTTPKEIKEIQDLLMNTNFSKTEIAKKYNISHVVVVYINQGSSWRNSNLEYPLRQKLEKKCKCGTEITKENGLCHSCAMKEKRIVERPSAEQLEKELRELNFVKVGKKYNVSDNAVRKWCESYGMSTKAKDYK